MPAVIPFIPLIAGGISAGATLLGAHEASSANTDAAHTQSDAAVKAAQIQAKSTVDALDFTKGIYRNTQQQVGPYVGYGQGALAALGNGLGVTPTAQTPPRLPGDPVAMPPGTKTLGLPQSISGGVFSPSTPAAPAAVQPGGGTLAGLGGAQTGSSVQMPQVGETRQINGQNAVWDGRGWKAA